jgi:yecA family protein
MKQQALTDAEFDRLSSVLERFGNERSMNVEQLDGFLAALVCSPDNVPPSEYLPEIWGGDIVLEDTFAAQPILEDFISLLMRHWNAIVGTLRSGDVHLPLLLKDESGVAHANDWATGFMRGMELRREDWAFPFAGCSKARTAPDKAGAARPRRPRPAQDRRAGVTGVNRRRGVFHIDFRNSISARRSWGLSLGPMRPGIVVPSAGASSNRWPVL